MRRLTHEETLSMMRQLNDNINFDKVSDTTKLYIEVECRSHGAFSALSSNLLNSHGCELCRKEKT